MAASVPVPAVTERALSALVTRAAEARRHAYAPYSRFRVGAAVLTGDGHMAGGCNVENASYGLTVCAERVALFAAVAEGHRRILALAVCAEPAAWPCGACRQVLAEFASEDCIVVVADASGEVARATLGELLPHSFTAPSGSPLEPTDSR